MLRLDFSSTLVIASWSLESLDKIELWAKFRFLKRENWWLPIPVPNKAALLLRRERRPRRRNFFHRWILQSDGLGCSREILPNQLLLFTVQLLPALSPARIKLLLLLVRIWANEYILSFPSLPMSRYFFAPAGPSVKKRGKNPSLSSPSFSDAHRGDDDGAVRQRRAAASLPPSIRYQKLLKIYIFLGRRLYVYIIMPPLPANWLFQLTNI